MDFANKVYSKAAVGQLAFYSLWERPIIYYIQITFHFLYWYNTKEKVYGDRFVKGTIMLKRFGQVINKMRYL